MKLASGTTARSLDEWQGATPDAAIPERVKIRIFNRYGGRCAITGKRLMPGEIDYDHIIPLRDGGLHCEANLQPVWRKMHREKTGAENSERAKIDEKRRKHFLPKPASKWPKRSFNWKPREADHDT